MTKTIINPDYLFEVSWEVCNKVGGIYTVIATKSLFLKSQLNKRHILIGPDVWMNPESNPDFIEDQNLYKAWKEQAAVEGLRLRVGRWNVPGEPVAILVDFKQFLPKQDSILTDFWLRFGVDSISGNWDYKENALFGYVAGKVIESFCRFNMEPSAKVVAQFHEWQTGGGLLYLKTTDLPIATVFTTHATVTGRCLAGNNMPLYDRMDSYNGDECAAQFGVTAMHSLEANAASVCTVNTNKLYQHITGFGGIDLPEWQGYALSDSEKATAFGNGANQLGLTVLRVYVNPDKNQMFPRGRPSGTPGLKSQGQVCEVNPESWTQLTRFLTRVRVRILCLRV